MITGAPKNIFKTNKKLAYFHKQFLSAKKNSKKIELQLNQRNEIVKNSCKELENFSAKIKKTISQWP